MKRVYNHRFKKEMYDLVIGDYIATREKEIIISTILGPCIAVCLIDKLTGTVGMNHFMMPGASKGQDVRYGLDSTEKLIEEMVCAGASENRLKAKVFGGAVMTNHGQATSKSSDNVPFIEEYLASKKIPIEARDTGSHCGRRIYFCTTTYAVWLKKFNKEFYQKKFAAGGFEEF